MNPEIRRCSDCGAEKTLALFQKNGKRPDGSQVYRPQCSECDRERQRLMREPNIITKPITNPRGADFLEEKTCTKCMRVFPINEFRSAGFRDGKMRRTSNCRYCLNERDKALYLADPNAKRDKDYRRRIGITLNDYERMLAAQGYRCLICGIHESEVVKRFSVDHDHDCCTYGNNACGECVRGLLCGPCNRGIGLFYDNPEALRTAAAYIEGAKNRLEVA